MPGRPRKSLHVIHAVQYIDIPLPQTLKEATDNKYASYWHAAMDYEALVANGTWTVANLLKGKQAIGCK